MKFEDQLIGFAETEIVAKLHAPVGVIIPCFNSEHTVLRAYDSVISQSLIPELIVFVDDASTDSTLDILKKIKTECDCTRVEIIELEVNSGASCARNLGMKLVDTKFFAFLDSDDAWHSEKIRLQYQWMLANPDCTLLAHRSVVDGEESLPDRFSHESFNYSVLKLSFESLLLRNRFSTPSVFLRNNIPFTFDTKLRYAEDYEFWLRIAATGGVVMFSNLPLTILYKSRYGAGGLSSHLWSMQLGVMKVYFKLYKLGFIGLGRLFFHEFISLLAFMRRIVSDFLKW